MTLAVACKKRDQPKERRRKAGQNENPDREDHEGEASHVKKLPGAGDVKNDTAGL